jgi:hypothetical protein
VKREESKGGLQQEPTDYNPVFFLCDCSGFFYMDMTIMENTPATLVFLSIYSFAPFYHICLMTHSRSFCLTERRHSLINVGDLPRTGNKKQRSVTLNIPHVV